MNLTRSVRSQEVGVRVSGEIDITTAPELAAFITAASAGGSLAMGIDLTDVTFLDSSGVRVLVRAAQEAAQAGTRLAVLCPPGNTPVRHVMDILQLSSVMTIVDS